MSKSVMLHLRFDKPISDGYWPVVVRALRNEYPGIHWNGGKPLDSRSGRSVVVLFITPRLGVAYSSSYINRMQAYGWGEIPESVNGEEWVAEHDTDFDQTSELFDSLNESSERYQPKLNLKFNPPLFYEESDTYYNKVINVLSQNYSNLKWYGGNPIGNYNPFPSTYEEDSMGDGIHYLTIGYYKDQPDSLTFTDDEYMEYNSIDGYRWVEENDVDYEKTNQLFDSLNEADLPWDEPDHIPYNFKVGDSVRMNPESTFFGEEENPDSEDVVGVIINIFEEDEEPLPIEVDWGSYTNTYNHEDLIFVDYVSTEKLFDSLNESITVNEVNKYNIGDRFYAPNSLYFDGKRNSENRFVTKGNTYEISDIETNYYWDDYGYRGNRYVLNTENSEGGDHGFSDVYLDRHFIPIPKDLSLEIDYDSLHETMGDYKSKMYIQKFEIGDRVVMNGTVGGKSLHNELGTVLKYKFTGGGAGHPHRVYLILFDNWNDKKGNFLMSPAQADQNRRFIDPRCSEGSCWYTTSDNLEPAPDSNTVFDSLNESPDYANRNNTPEELQHRVIIFDKGNIGFNDVERLLKFFGEAGFRVEDWDGENMNELLSYINDPYYNKKGGYAYMRTKTIDLVYGDADTFIRRKIGEYNSVTPYSEFIKTINHDFFDSLNESENKIDYSFLNNGDLVGIKFYEPKEFKELGTIYTITEVIPYSKNIHKRKIKVEWDNTTSKNWNDQQTTLSLHQFINDLTDGYLIILPEESIESEDIFNSLNEDRNLDYRIKGHYNIDDLEYFYTNKTTILEINPETEEPFMVDSWHIKRGMLTDGEGHVIYHIGKCDSERYCVCWYVGGREDCIDESNGRVIKQLNNGRMIPLDIYKSNFDSFSAFGINESEDLDWTDDVVSEINFEPQEGSWVVTNTGQHYPWNPDMWDYFDIPGVNKCLTGEGPAGLNMDTKCVDDLYDRGILIHPQEDDICFVDKKIWTKNTGFSKEPVYHCVNQENGGHFLIGSSGLKRI